MVHLLPYMQADFHASGLHLDIGLDDIRVEDVPGAGVDVGGR